MMDDDLVVVMVVNLADSLAVLSDMLMAAQMVGYSVALLVVLMVEH